MTYPSNPLSRDRIVNFSKQEDFFKYQVTVEKLNELMVILENCTGSLKLPPKTLHRLQLVFIHATEELKPDDKKEQITFKTLK